MHNPVSNTGLQRLISAQWPKLTSCNLSNVAVNIYLPAGGPALTWHQLIEANWPMLSSLDVFGNGIKATMMKNIVEVQFSCIKKLNLSYNALDSVAIGHLVKGPWLQLCDFHLTNALHGSIADCLVLLSTLFGSLVCVTVVCLCSVYIGALASDTSFVWVSSN